MVFVPALVVQPQSQAATVSTIKPTDDAYVAADLNNNGTDSLKSLKTGNLPILKVWYAWNLTITNKTGAVVNYLPVKILTVAYFKFNLSSFSGINSARLNLYSQSSNLTSASRFIVAYLVLNSSWSQGALDWNDAPVFYTNQNSTVPVGNGVNGWYTLDLTKMAQQESGRQLSVALTFLMLYQHNEEQVVFNSTRAAGAQPYLSVTYTGSSPWSLGGLYDFSDGLNSTNIAGILLIVVIVVAVAALWLGRRAVRLDRRG
jgi:hypothetical protein